MIAESHKVIEDFINEMQIVRSVQTGYINVPLTNMLADRGEVIFLTESQFNPFEENKNVILLNNSFVEYAYSFKNKHGRLDVCVFGHTNTLSDFRTALCAWTPLVRKNGVMIFLNSDNEDIQQIINEYVAQIDIDYFEITRCADITFVKVK
jgi:hypothetical protein